MEKIDIAKLLEEINDDSHWTEFGETTISEHNVGRESMNFLKQLGNLVAKAHENEWNSISQSLSILLMSIMKGDEVKLHQYLNVYLSNLSSREKIRDGLIRDKEDAE